ncbi:hypothetical protein [uncultured Winogradskyella sp.]|uniref:hypothetical protein n=1 Tax=uncultured Winogradskyella sp. TaxID=395353 RepID=UPI002604F771|nr:hypothetical protein [uncultured Winogradskyella sp.]
MKKLLILTIYYCFITFGYSQEPIYVQASEIGNGIGFDRLGESFVLTPAHVVDTSIDDIVLSDNRKSNSQATLLETYTNDIAILRVKENNQKSKYQTLKLSKVYKEAIANASSGFVAYLDGLGIVNYIHVNITSKDQSSFTVTPQSNNHTFKKGMSGSPFYIMHNGEKTLAGMLMSIEEGSVDGFIYQWDDIITTVSSFIEEDIEKKVIKLGVKINVKDSEDLSIVNRVKSTLKTVKNYTLLNRLPDPKFINKHLEAIINGSFFDDMSAKIQNGTDQLLLGKLSVSYDSNEKNMQLVYITFEGGLYLSEDSSLIKSISINTKGLGFKKASAKEQAIKSILTKLKNQIYED